MVLPQEVSKSPAPGTESAADGSWLAWLWQQPYVLETLLALTVIGVAVFVYWRFTVLVRNASRREALQDYLLGVEQALQGDLPGAEKRLRKVLDQDPENHYARLLLGKVLNELGHSEQAHQQHLYLKKAFAVDSAENELMLARSLLASGMPAEAADVAERALDRLPNHVEGRWFAYRARLQSGEHEAAARIGRQLLDLLSDRNQKQRLREDLGRTVATLATMRWRDGDRRAARQLQREAESLAEGLPPLMLLHARLDARDRGVGEVARQLAAPASERERSVIVREGVPPATGDRLPVASFAGLIEPVRWRCRACDAPLERQLGECPRCGAAEPAELIEPELVASIENPTEWMDRVDVNDAHVQRLVRQFVDGDEAVGEQLLELGDASVGVLLRTAWKNSGRVRDAAIGLLRRCGPECIPALFAASEQLQDGRLLGVGEGPDAIVGRIVQGFGREALPHIERLFGSSRTSHRRILIDYFLGLGDIDAFQQVLERLPPMEILHCCNHADPEVLRRFLQAIPRGHFLAESLLLERTFYRDEDLLAAVPDAHDPEVLVQVMIARGPSRALVKALIAGVAEDRLAAVSQRVLEELGEAALAHALQAYADPDCPEAVQRRLARVLVRGGAAAATRIARSFGPEASRLDDRLRHLLVVIGDDAIAAMVAAYERSDWFEKISAGLLRRHNNQRMQLANALGELGTPKAKKALQGLLKREKDDNLRLHVTHVLHRLEGRA